VQAAEAEHEQQQQALREQLAASQADAERLRERMSQLEAGNASLQEAAQQAQQQADQAEATLASCRRELAGLEERFRQQVEDFQSREASLLREAQEQGSRHAAEVAQLQQALEEERRRATAR
jgi:hypothetical protein